MMLILISSYDTIITRKKIWICVHSTTKYITFLWIKMQLTVLLVLYIHVQRQHSIFFETPKEKQCPHYSHFVLGIVEVHDYQFRLWHDKIFPLFRLDWFRSKLYFRPSRFQWSPEIHRCLYSTFLRKNAPSAITSYWYPICSDSCIIIFPYKMEYKELKKYLSIYISFDIMYLKKFKLINWIQYHTKTKFIKLYIIIYVYIKNNNVLGIK